jgi:1-acyl-sn-glycerol-3-phosphate acyltransferase
MTDVHEEADWFPRELRDYWSVSLVEAMVVAVWAAAVAVSTVRGTASGWTTGQPAPWQEDLLLAVGPLGIFVLVPFTVVLLLVTTRYRHLGLVAPYSTAVCIFCGLVLSSPADCQILALNVGTLCIPLLIPVGRFPRRPRSSSPSVLGGGEHAIRLHSLLNVYWWIKRGIQVSAIGSVLLTLFLMRSNAFAERVAAALPWLLFLLSAVLCAWCWLRLFRPFFELCCEPFFRPLYKIRARGPGVKAVPPLGPVLVIANHAAWFDPVFLGEFIPRPITPLMTESFYNIWFIRPILKYVFRVIVVREQAARREAPELQQAIAALGRGECVVLFPEGFLRRKEEMVLRRFAQGVWHILTARPDTPVVACWIEGGWESTFSWRGGPPVKGKRLDFRRPIDVGVNAPEVVPAGVLADPMRTRLHLMNRVSAARTHIGLEPLPPFTLPAEAEPVQSEQSA